MRETSLALPARPSARARGERPQRGSRCRDNFASSDMRSPLASRSALPQVSKPAQNPARCGGSVTRCSKLQSPGCARSVPVVAYSDNGAARRSRFTWPAIARGRSRPLGALERIHPSAWENACFHSPFGPSNLSFAAAEEACSGHIRRSTGDASTKLSSRFSQVT